MSPADVELAKIPQDGKPPKGLEKFPGSSSPTTYLLSNGATYLGRHNGQDVEITGTEQGIHMHYIDKPTEFDIDYDGTHREGVVLENGDIVTAISQESIPGASASTDVG